MNLRPSGYEHDELIFRKFLKTRNLRYHNGLAVFFHDQHVDHGDHDEHDLATFWLQWHECASEKSAHPIAVCDHRGVSPTTDFQVGSSVATIGPKIVWTKQGAGSPYRHYGCKHFRVTYTRPAWGVPNALRDGGLLGYLCHADENCPAFGRKETRGEPLGRKHLERRRESAGRIGYITTTWGLAPG